MTHADRTHSPAQRSTGPLTAWLRSADEGCEGAIDEVYRLAYDRLVQRATVLLRGQRTGHTLDAEALVGEAFLKVRSGEHRDWRHSGEFLALMAYAMRQVLIDYSRRHQALRRGGEFRRRPLTGIEIEIESRVVDHLTLHEALTELRESELSRGPGATAEVSEVIELRFFQGLSVQEVAAHTGRSKRAVERDWTFGRAWLVGRLAE